MRLLLLAAAGGALGSAARYLVNVEAFRVWGQAFPWSTLIVNGMGCLIMGVAAEVIAVCFGGSPALRTFLMTGILGGFTTFSAFALDFAALIERKSHLAAACYLGASVGLSLIGVYVGLAIARAWLN
jgi:fluoride exporter